MARATADDEFLARLKGSGLTTVEFHFYYPDHPRIISPNTILHQFMDIHPDFPVLRKYLRYWSEHIQARIERVRVAHSLLLKPAELRCIDGEFRLH